MTNVFKWNRKWWKQSSVDRDFILPIFERQINKWNEDANQFCFFLYISSSWSFISTVSIDTFCLWPAECWRWVTVHCFRLVAVQYFKYRRDNIILVINKGYLHSLDVNKRFSSSSSSCYYRKAVWLSRKRMRPEKKWTI